MSLQPAQGNPSDSKRLIEALRSGTDLDTATLFAGLEPADFTPELWQQVLKARAEAIVRAVAQIQKAASQGDWKAAAWWLEHNVPEYRTRSEKVLATTELVCPEGHRITVTRQPVENELCGLCGGLMQSVC